MLSFWRLANSTTFLWQISKSSLKTLESRVTFGDLGCGNAEIARPLVEVAGVTANGVVRVLGDVGEHAADGFLDLGLRFWP